MVGSALARVEKAPRVTAASTSRLPPDLPLVPLDRVLIEQVLINLLDNAIKYTPEGSPIDISAAAEDGVVGVTVADRGPGFAPGEEAQVFEKFYRGHGRGDAAAAPAWASRSPGGSWRRTAGGSAPNPARVAAPCSASPCRWPRSRRRSGRTMAETPTGGGAERPAANGPVVLVIEDEPPHPALPPPHAGEPGLPVRRGRDR